MTPIQETIINKKTTKGILVRGYKKEDISKIDVINEGIIKGSLDDFDSKSISIGRDLALNLDVSIGGFPEEEDWILYGPYSDKSLIRNKLTFDLSNAIGFKASKTKFYNLFINY